MSHPLFNRVKIRINREKQSLEDFIQAFCREFHRNDCLLVMNTKKAALQLFSALRDRLPSYRLFCLTTLSVPADRRRIIGQIRAALENNEPVVAVTTQMIEAGVDLSFQTVYRDFGPLDSIIQVAGRCNRNGEYGMLGGNMTVVNLTHVRESQSGISEKPFHEYVYNSYVIQAVKDTLVDDYYESAQLAGLAEAYFRKLDFTADSLRILKAVCGLVYDGSARGAAVCDFKLIDQIESTDVYILTTPEAEGRMERLLELSAMVVSVELTSEEQDHLRLEMETLKTELRDYCISLRDSESAAYKDAVIIKGEGFYRYIGYEDQRRYAYDEDTGFLLTPAESVSGALCI